MNPMHELIRLLIFAFFIGVLSACSSSNTRSSDVYYNTGYYDSYYRNGINTHHYRNYRHPRPVRRPVRTR
jgi:uncharacterized lipoprotein